MNHRGESRRRQRRASSTSCSQVTRSTTQATSSIAASRAASRRRSAGLVWNRRPSPSRSSRYSGQARSSLTCRPGRRSRSCRTGSGSPWPGRTPATGPPASSRWERRLGSARPRRRGGARTIPAPGRPSLKKPDKSRQRRGRPAEHVVHRSLEPYGRYSCQLQQHLSRHATGRADPGPLETFQRWATTPLSCGARAPATQTSTSGYRSGPPDRKTGGRYTAGLRQQLRLVLDGRRYTSG